MMSCAIKSILRFNGIVKSVPAALLLKSYRGLNGGLVFYAYT